MEELGEVERARIADKILRVREEPSYSCMLDFVRALDRCVVNSASVVGIRADAVTLVRDMAFQGAFQICFVDVAPKTAVDYFFSYIDQTTSAFTDVTLERKKTIKRSPLFLSHPPSFSSHSVRQLNLNAENLPKFQECFAMYHLAVSTLLGEEIASFDGRHILRKLIASLDLSFDDLGRIFRVSGETVRRWENGANGIPVDRNAEITLTREPLNTLLEMFRPAKLPQVIRRRAQLFDGERALDWILQGRLRDVADRYEITLRYQA